MEERLAVGVGAVDIGPGLHERFDDGVLPLEIGEHHHGHPALDAVLIVPRIQEHLEGGGVPLREGVSGRRLPLVVLRAQECPGLEGLLDEVRRLRRAVLRQDMEDGVALVVHLAYVRPVADEEIHQGQVTVVRRLEKEVPAGGIDHLLGESLVQVLFHIFEVAAPHGVHEELLRRLETGKSAHRDYDDKSPREKPFHRFPPGYIISVHHKWSLSLSVQGSGMPDPYTRIGAAPTASPSVR